MPLHFFRPEASVPAATSVSVLANICVSLRCISPLLFGDFDAKSHDGCFGVRKKSTWNK
jgi:hypothetical protein